VIRGAWDRPHVVLIICSSTPVQDRVMHSERAPGRRRTGRGAALFAIAAVTAAMTAGPSTSSDVAGHAYAVGSSSASRPLRIMPLGSSSTVGAGSLGTAGFRGPLEALLARDGIPFDMVGSQHSGPPSVPDLDHEGHGGWTMTRMQPLVAGWVTAAHPDVILLQVGTNDLLSGAGAAVTAKRLDTMLTTIHSVSSASVVVELVGSFPGSATCTFTLASG